MNSFDVVNGLLTLEQNGKTIEEFFVDNDVHNVIIYGLGTVGYRVYEAVKKTDVNIVCAIDQYANEMEIEGLSVMQKDQLSALDSQADLIIVTPMAYYWDIKSDLERITNIDVISIGEIVEYCVTGENFPQIKWKEQNLVMKEQEEKERKIREKIDHSNRSKSVVVFGGSSGIGKAIARQMLDVGSKVAIVGRSEKRLLTAGEELNSPNLFTIAADISEVKKHNELIGKAEELMGEVDAFVNAAAVSLENIGRGYEPWDITEEEWDYMADIDLKAAFFLIRNEVDYFQQKNIPGNILNISSNAGYMDVEGIYGVSKLAIAKWTRTFGKRFGREGIIINGIAPGVTFTPMVSNYAKEMDQPYLRHAIGRFIRPEEIACLAHECLTEKGIILCGSTIVADGGAVDTVL